MTTPPDWNDERPYGRQQGPYGGNGNGYDYGYGDACERGYTHGQGQGQEPGHGHGHGDAYAYGHDTNPAARTAGPAPGPAPGQYVSQPLPHEQPYGPYDPYAHAATAVPPARTHDDHAAPASPPRPAPRTGSPVIPSGMQPALITAALGVLIAATADLARPALAVAVVLLQAVTAAGWFRLNGMWPARQGIALAFLAGLVVDVALLTTPGEQAPTVVVGVLGVWIVPVLVQQMRHRGSADERLASLTATAASTVLTVLAGGYLAIAGTSAGSAPVVVGAVAVAVATVTRAVRLPCAVSITVALLAAVGSGVTTGRLTGMGTDAVLLASAAGCCALIGLRVASYDFPSRFVHFTAGVALPLMGAAPAVYLLGRVLAG